MIHRHSKSVKRILHNRQMKQSGYVINVDNSISLFMMTRCQLIVIVRIIFSLHFVACHAKNDNVYDIILAYKSEEFKRKNGYSTLDRAENLKQSSFYS